MQGSNNFRRSSYFFKKNKLAPRRILGSKFNKLFLFLSVFLLLIFSLGILYAYSYSNEGKQTNRLLAINSTAQEKSQAGNTLNKISSATISANTPTPDLPTPTSIPTNTPEPTPTQGVLEKGKATQIDENTWSVEIESDSKMANVNEIFQALNSYRSKRGVGALIWDNTLAAFAQSRANFFNSQGSLDNHAGFQEYMNNGGFEKSGFNGLGENSAFMAGPMSGAKIIESLFAADAPHDNNQTDPSWTHVGIGLSGNAVNINFGKNKR